MRICKIWDSEYPWDVRAEKIARSLTEAGHEVHMVARNRMRRPEREQLTECVVHRIPPLPVVADMPGIGDAINAASMFPAFFNPRWLRRIRVVATEIRADLILCRDLPLLPTAVWVGRRLNIPVILDMAENYAAMIRGVWDNGRHRWSDWLVRNPRIIEAVERWSIRHADHIIVVVEESRDRLVSLGVSEGRITIVSNTPPKSRAAGLLDRAAPSSLRGAIELVYLGLLEAPRGIATLIEAVRQCRDRGTDVRLTLIGDGRDRRDFEIQARSFDPTGTCVRFRGYVPNSDALAALRFADIGVIPHHSDESWNSTIPNKLFDYMAAGIPVVASDTRPVQRVVQGTGCGRTFRDRDAADLAATILSLSEPISRRACAEAGHRAIEARYNWEEDSRRLLASVESFGADRHRSSDLLCV
jgi:glycosyltransferase involved in cell wall biosynthesis